MSSLCSILILHRNVSCKLSLEFRKDETAGLKLFNYQALFNFCRDDLTYPNKMNWPSIAVSTQALFFPEWFCLCIIFHAVMAVLMCWEIFEIGILHCWWWGWRGFRRLWNLSVLGDIIMKVPGLAGISFLFYTIINFFRYSVPVFLCMVEKDGKMEYLCCLWAQYLSEILQNCCLCFCMTFNVLISL